MADAQWTTACPDWERRIVAGESLVPCGPIFPSQATEGLDIFKQLVAVDVAGSPTFGQISRAWILDIVAAIFGAYDDQTGRRLIREVFLLISKKNGKSTDLAGIILTAFLMNWRDSGEMGILAPTIEVANNAWKPARDAIHADEELSDLLQVQEHIRTITHRGTKATLQVVAAENETVAGKKWIVTLVDELWLFGKRLNAANMLLEATGGLASRPEGFVMYSSTQADGPPAGVFKAKLEYARAVRDGKIHDPEFLPIIYEFPKALIESKGYMDERNWHITNPNMGASVDPTYIRRKIKEAEYGQGDDTLQAVLSKHLNVEIGLNLRSDRWAGADYWEERAVPLTLDDLLDQCEVVTVGIDGGGLDDLLGFTVVGRKNKSDEWLSWSKAWAHPIALERRKSEASRYRDFEAQGDLRIIEQLPGDVAEVADLVVKILESGLLHSIGMDPEKTHKVMYEELVNREIDPKIMFGVTQGWRLCGPINLTERKLAEGKLKHAKQPLMDWCVGNAKIVANANSILITKQASGFAKIDPLMALFNAVSLMAMNPEAMGDKYEIHIF